MITSWLPEVSLVCLSYTCRYFRALIGFTPAPQRLAIAWFNLEREGRDPTRQRLTCSKCLRLRRFFHFEKKQASLKIAPNTRRCLDCSSSPYRLRLLLGQKLTWISTTKMTVCPHCRQMVIYESDNCSNNLVISPHVGDSICARHRHYVHPGRSRLDGPGHSPYSSRCVTCYWKCSTPGCLSVMYWGDRLCGKGHENDPPAWDVPEQLPSSPEIVVSRLRVMLDQAWPPPLRCDFFRSPRQGYQNNSICELIQTLLTNRLEPGKLPEDGLGGLQDAG